MFADAEALLWYDHALLSTDGARNPLIAEQEEANRVAAANTHLGPHRQQQPQTTAAGGAKVNPRLQRVARYYSHLCGPTLRRSDADDTAGGGAGGRGGPSSFSSAAASYYESYFPDDNGAEQQREELGDGGGVCGAADASVLSSCGGSVNGRFYRHIVKTLESGGRTPAPLGGGYAGYHRGGGGAALDSRGEADPPVASSSPSQQQQLLSPDLIFSDNAALFGLDEAGNAVDERQRRSREQHQAKQQTQQQQQHDNLSKSNLGVEEETVLVPYLLRKAGGSGGGSQRSLRYTHVECAAGVFVVVIGGGGKSGGVSTVDTGQSPRRATDGAAPEETILFFDQVNNIPITCLRVSEIKVHRRQKGEQSEGDDGSDMFSPKAPGADAVANSNPLSVGTASGPSVVNSSFRSDGANGSHHTAASNSSFARRGSGSFASSPPVSGPRAVAPPATPSEQRPWYYLDKSERVHKVFLDFTGRFCVVSFVSGRNVYFYIPRRRDSAKTNTAGDDGDDSDGSRHNGSSTASEPTAGERRSQWLKVAKRYLTASGASHGSKSAANVNNSSFSRKTDVAALSDKGAPVAFELLISSERDSARPGASMEGGGSPLSPGSPAAVVGRSISPRDAIHCVCWNPYYYFGLSSLRARFSSSSSSSTSSSTDEVLAPTGEVLLSCVGGRTLFHTCLTTSVAAPCVVRPLYSIAPPPPTGGEEEEGAPFSSIDSIAFYISERRRASPSSTSSASVGWRTAAAAEEEEEAAMGGKKNRKKAPGGKPSSSSAGRVRFAESEAAADDNNDDSNDEEGNREGTTSVENENETADPLLRRYDHRAHFLHESSPATHKEHSGSNDNNSSSSNNFNKSASSNMTSAAGSLAATAALLAEQKSGEAAAYGGEDSSGVFDPQRWGVGGGVPAARVDANGGGSVFPRDTDGGNSNDKDLVAHECVVLVAVGERLYVFSSGDLNPHLSTENVRRNNGGRRASRSVVCSVQRCNVFPTLFALYRGGNGSNTHREGTSPVESEDRVGSCRNFIVFRPTTEANDDAASGSAGGHGATVTRSVVEIMPPEYLVGRRSCGGPDGAAATPPQTFQPPPAFYWRVYTEPTAAQTSAREMKQRKQRYQEKKGENEQCYLVHGVLTLQSNRMHTLSAFDAESAPIRGHANDSVAQKRQDTTAAPETSTHALNTGDEDKLEAARHRWQNFVLDGNTVRDYMLLSSRSLSGPTGGGAWPLHRDTTDVAAASSAAATGVAAGSPVFLPIGVLSLVNVTASVSAIADRVLNPQSPQVGAAASFDPQQQSNFPDDFVSAASADNKGGGRSTKSADASRQQSTPPSMEESLANGEIELDADIVAIQAVLHKLKYLSGGRADSSGENGVGASTTIPSAAAAATTTITAADSSSSPSNIANNNAAAPFVIRSFASSPTHIAVTASRLVRNAASESEYSRSARSTDYNSSSTSRRQQQKRLPSPEQEAAETDADTDAEVETGPRDEQVVVMLFSHLSFIPIEAEHSRRLENRLVYFYTYTIPASAVGSCGSNSGNGGGGDDGVYLFNVKWDAGSTWRYLDDATADAAERSQRQHQQQLRSTSAGGRSRGTATLPTATGGKRTVHALSPFSFTLFNGRSITTLRALIGAERQSAESPSGISPHDPYGGDAGSDAGRSVDADVGTGGTVEKPYMVAGGRQGLVSQCLFYAFSLMERGEADHVAIMAASAKNNNSSSSSTFLAPPLTSSRAAPRSPQSHNHRKSSLLSGLSAAAAAAAASSAGGAQSSAAVNERQAAAHQDELLADFLRRNPIFDTLLARLEAASAAASSPTLLCIPGFGCNAGGVVDAHPAFSPPFQDPGSASPLGTADALVLYSYTVDQLMQFALSLVLSYVAQCGARPLGARRCCGAGDSMRAVGRGQVVLLARVRSVYANYLLHGSASARERPLEAAAQLGKIPLLALPPSARGGGGGGSGGEAAALDIFSFNQYVSSAQTALIELTRVALRGEPSRDSAADSKQVGPRLLSSRFAPLVLFLKLRLETLEAVRRRGLYTLHTQVKAAITRQMSVWSSLLFSLLVYANSMTHGETSGGATGGGKSAGPDAVSAGDGAWQDAGSWDSPLTTSATRGRDNGPLFWEESGATPDVTAAPYSSGIGAARLARVRVLSAHEFLVRKYSLDRPAALLQDFMLRFGCYYLPWTADMREKIMVLKPNPTYSGVTDGAPGTANDSNGRKPTSAGATDAAGQWGYLWISTLFDRSHEMLPTLLYSNDANPFLDDVSMDAFGRKDAGKPGDGTDAALPSSSSEASASAPRSTHPECAAVTASKPLYARRALAALAAAEAGRRRCLEGLQVLEDSTLLLYQQPYPESASDGPLGGGDDADGAPPAMSDEEMLHYFTSNVARAHREYFDPSTPQTDTAAEPPSASPEKEDGKSGSPGRRSSYTGETHGSQPRWTSQDHDDDDGLGSETTSAPTGTGTETETMQDVRLPLLTLERFVEEAACMSQLARGDSTSATAAAAAAAAQRRDALVEKLYIRHRLGRPRRAGTRSSTFDGDIFSPRFQATLWKVYAPHFLSRVPHRYLQRGLLTYAAGLPLITIPDIRNENILCAEGDGDDNNNNNNTNNNSNTNRATSANALGGSAHTRGAASSSVDPRRVSTLELVHDTSAGDSRTSANDSRMSVMGSGVPCVAPRQDFSSLLIAFYHAARQRNLRLTGLAASVGIADTSEATRSAAAAAATPASSNANLPVEKCVDAFGAERTLEAVEDAPVVAARRSAAHRQVARLIHQRVEEAPIMGIVDGADVTGKGASVHEGETHESHASQREESADSEIHESSLSGSVGVDAESFDDVLGTEPGEAPDEGEKASIHAEKKRHVSTDGARSPSASNALVLLDAKIATQAEGVFTELLGERCNNGGDGGAGEDAILAAFAACVTSMEDWVSVLAPSAAGTDGGAHASPLGGGASQSAFGAVSTSTRSHAASTTNTEPNSPLSLTRPERGGGVPASSAFAGHPSEAVNRLHPDSMRFHLVESLFFSYGYFIAQECAARESRAVNGGPGETSNGGHQEGKAATAPTPPQAPPQQPLSECPWNAPLAYLWEKKMDVLRRSGAESNNEPMENDCFPSKFTLLLRSVVSFYYRLCQTDSSTPPYSSSGADVGVDNHTPAPSLSSSPPQQQSKQHAEQRSVASPSRALCRAWCRLLLGDYAEAVRVCLRQLRDVTTAVEFTRRAESEMLAAVEVRERRLLRRQQQQEEEADAHSASHSPAAGRSTSSLAHAADERNACAADTDYDSDDIFSLTGCLDNMTAHSAAEAINQLWFTIIEFIIQRDTMTGPPGAGDGHTSPWQLSGDKYVGPNGALRLLADEHQMRQRMRRREGEEEQEGEEGSGADDHHLIRLADSGVDSEADSIELPEDGPEGSATRPQQRGGETARRGSEGSSSEEGDDNGGYDDVSGGGGGGDQCDGDADLNYFLTISNVSAILRLMPPQVRISSFRRELTASLLLLSSRVRQMAGRTAKLSHIMGRMQRESRHLRQHSALALRLPPAPDGAASSSHAPPPPARRAAGGGALTGVQYTSSPDSKCCFCHTPLLVPPPPSSAHAGRTGSAGRPHADPPLVCFPNCSHAAHARCYRERRVQLGVADSRAADKVPTCLLCSVDAVRLGYLLPLEADLTESRTLLL